MTQHILYIQGVASPYQDEKIAQEIAEHADHLDCLRQNDAEVLSVGDPRSGCTLEAIEHVIKNNPSIDIVIAQIHGNISRGFHFLGVTKGSLDESGNVWAQNFYKALARAAQDRPLNIFLSSCGSGNSCREAVDLLPPGSTLVNFTEQDTISSYFVAAQSLKAVPHPTANFVEALFLNMLCNGMPHGGYKPQISVSASSVERNIWPLWRHVQGECLDYETVDQHFATAARDYLRPYVTDDVLSQAFASMQGYMQGIRSSRTFKVEGSPVEFSSVLDDEAVLHEFHHYGLFGPLCAIAFFFNREAIGAFQIKDREFYTSPKRPRPNASGNQAPIEPNGQ